MNQKAEANRERERERRERDIYVNKIQVYKNNLPKPYQ